MAKHKSLFRPEEWPPEFEKIETDNRVKHSGTIKSKLIMYHTLVKQYIYTIYVFNPSKNIFENLGEYVFIGEDALSYKFELMHTQMSNIDFSEITLPKMCDDRYFFEANNPVGLG